MDLLSGKWISRTKGSLSGMSKDIVEGFGKGAKIIAEYRERQVLEQLVEGSRVPLIIVIKICHSLVNFI